MDHKAMSMNFAHQLADAVAAERERCAEIADRHSKTLTNGGAINACRAIANQIRKQ